MLGPILAAGASLVSSFLGNKAQKDANAAAAAQNKAQIAWGREQMAAQKEYATHGIRWKVRDAEKAGLHPLAALGAQTTSFSPVSVGSSLAGDNGWYRGIADAGQDIGRAIDATRTSGEKAQAMMNSLQLENMGLQNDLLRSQIARNSQINQPPFPGSTYLLDGQTGSGMPPGTSLINTGPMDRSAVSPTAPHSEPGAIADTGWSTTAKGGLAPQFSRDMADRMDENHIGALAWGIRNYALPYLGMGTPPPAPVPEGYDAWIWDPVDASYRPAHSTWFPGVYSHD